MIKKILVSTLAVGAIALGAPVAHADHVQFDCGFDTIAQETATGGQDTFTGVAYGYAISPTTSDVVDIACYVQVDGSPATSTAGDGNNGNNVDTYAQQVTYTALPAQDVKLCWIVRVNGVGHVTGCAEVTTTQIPPQAVLDLLDGIFDLITQIEIDVVDPILCPILIAVGAALGGGVPGVLEINAQGDVFLLGDPFWDCPPYDLFPPE